VYLHDHASIGTPLPQPAIDRQHRALDNLGGSTLHGRIDCSALGGLHPHLVPGIDLRQVQASPEQGFNIPLLPGQATSPVHVFLYTGIALEIAVDILLRLIAPKVQLFRQAEDAARRFDTRIAMFGVFPSVTTAHLNPDGYMTELHRYNQLNRQLLSMRGMPIHLHLDGDEQLVVEKDDVMLEALATSLQIHLQVPFDEIVPTYHAGLWSSMLILGATANSPLVLGKCCWQESRIGIFKQAVDTRNEKEIEDHIIPRVHLGKRYIESLFDLFEDNFNYYSPILPEVLDEPIENLHHLQLHDGTISRWVRPIIARNGDGSYHLRLELRVVPSGPTLVDTVANIVFYVGLTEGLKTLGEQLKEVPYVKLETDFYRAAREGLEASAHWPDGEKRPLKKILLEQALPLARDNFERAGIEDTGRWLDIIEARVDSGATGASWISRHWKQFGDSARLVREYIEQAQTNRPVHQWRDPGT